MIKVLKLSVFSFVAGLLLCMSAPAGATGYENSKISLLTCSGGSEIYSTFGHSALRVIDDSLGIDIVFNFGLFDFNTPNFYTKFMRGKLNYLLGIQNTSDFLWQYSYEGRGVVEQELEFNPSVKNELMDRLNFLYKPENRYYLYSFLFKNCTTELRDLLRPYVSFPEGKEELNFRELINISVGNSKWTKTGINLILGSNLDRDISIWEGMFLPDKLYDGLKPVSEGRVILPRSDNSLSSSTPFLISPLFISILLFSLLLLSRFFKVLKPVQIITLSLSALFGVVLVLIILLTDHIELYSNYNLLWCNPLYLVLLITYPFARRIKKVFKILTILMMCFSLTAAIVWINGMQGFLPEYIIIVISQIIMLGGLRYKLDEKGS